MDDDPAALARVVLRNLSTRERVRRHNFGQAVVMVGEQAAVRLRAILHAAVSWRNYVTSPGSCIVSSESSSMTLAAAHFRPSVSIGMP
jgi:hypothetical protein